VPIIIIICNQLCGELQRMHSVAYAINGDADSGLRPVMISE